MEKFFSICGNSTTCCANNGSPCTSDAMRELAAAMGFKRCKATPYHSLGKGEAQAYMKLLKSVLIP